jgi:chaperone modulatory protein CbpM
MDECFHDGEIVSEARTYTLVEVCTICGVHAAGLGELVAFGIVEPTGKTYEMWRFSESAVQRTKRALRLRRDLGLDAQGLALSLDLLDEIERLHRMIARLSG